MFSSKLAKSTDHQTPESRSRTGHLNPGKKRDLQCREGYKGGCSFGGVMGRGKVPREECGGDSPLFLGAGRQLKAHQRLKSR